MIKLNFEAKAFGLVEVLIAIAISGVILMGSITVAVRSSQLIRENEMIDIASGLLLRVIEIARSPQDINLIGAQGNARLKYYKLSTNDNKISLIDVTDDNQLVSCSANSEYFVKLEDENLVFCNQAIIRDISLNSNSTFVDFEIKSVVVFEFFGNMKSQELVTYRSEIRK